MSDDPRAWIESLDRRLAPLLDESAADVSAPGAAAGVILDGVLATSRGWGHADLAAATVPTAATPFRIASMTKSFTAAAVLHLRDAGALALGDPVRRHVPEATGLAAVGRELTVTDVLSMNGGLAEDDPLGDRLQAMAATDFDRMLASPAVAVNGGGFEYSNYGYAILGRLIGNVSGVPFTEYITTHLLNPLGMTASSWVRPPGMATGHVRRDDRWVVEPIDGPGAFGAMGGLFSTVEDVARWVQFLLGEGGEAVLSAASRREMAGAWVPRPVVRPHGAGPDHEVLSAAYGFGLSVAHSPRFGPLVWHSGGYPGFGSVMMWAPRLRCGVVILMNGRYAPASRVALDVFHDVFPAPAAVIAHPTFSVLQQRISDLLDELPGDVPFAVNVELDEPWDDRRVVAAEARQVLGSAPQVTMAEMRTPLDGRWRLDGVGGSVTLSMMLGPVQPIEVQTLEIDIARSPSAALHAAAEAAWARWLAASQERPGAPRPEAPWSALHVARRAGPIVDVPVLVAGDGVSTSTWRVATGTGSWSVTVVVDDGGAVVSTKVTPD